MNIKISDLWRWDGRIGRANYLVLGSMLFLVKFNVDRLVASQVFDQPWSISQYANIGELIPGAASDAELLTLLVISLPFLWFGLVLSLRRLRAAGLPLVLVFLFVVPVVKIIFFIALSALPDQEIEDGKLIVPSRAGRFLQRLIPRHAAGSAAAGILVTLLLTLAAFLLGTTVFVNYGWSLFIGLPFCMGFFSVLIYGFHEPRTFGKCFLVVFYTMLSAAAGLLLFDFEGVICLIMAAPVALVMGLAGGFVAYLIQERCRWREDSPKLLCSVILIVPLAMDFEHHETLEPPLFKVQSSVIVNASPETVWRNVVTFGKLPAPDEWMFRAGIAYPVGAEIQGHGPGAIRYCNFSTGPFVEPIEVWNEPSLLKFSVTHNPSPMRELSFYPDLHPPHLDGFLVSKQGQFHLIKLGDNQTLLEGTTWYQHNLWPAQYWRFWSDYIIHTIHLRVLNHVKELSESEKSKA